MLFKAGVSLAGLDIRMRPALIAADSIWQDFGRPEGVTVTSSLDGVHSPGSLHYYGLALDFRIHYFEPDISAAVFQALTISLGTDFDVVLHSTHIHVEFTPGDLL